MKMKLHSLQTGGIVYPLMFRSVIRAAGFGWAVRSIAFVMFGLYMVSYLPLIYHRKPPQTIRRFFDKSVLGDTPFLILCIASVFSATAYYIHFIYLPLLTKVRVPVIEQDLGFNLLAILNGSSAVGRLLAGIAAAKFGPTETIFVSLVLGSIVLFCWILVDSIQGTIAWSVLWGMVSGVLVALPGAFIPLFCPFPAFIGTRSGMYWVFVGAGLLIGSPIGGAIYDVRMESSGSWRMQVFAGTFMMGAAMFTLYPLIHLRLKAGATGIS
jgi:MFS family permease